MRYIICRFCGHENPTGGDACENCGAEFNEGMPESASTFEGRLLGTALGALATGEPLWLSRETSALMAVERMKAAGVDYVLVGDGIHLDGIFSDRDAMLRLPGRAAPAPKLAEVMTREPVVLRPEDTVALGIHKMAVAEVRHLPLAGDGGVVGVIAARDIFRHLATRLDVTDARRRGDGRGPGGGTD
jgi:signal-transduction protein with cAMP-binding, CBS, and nucleotidyltransferase domain